MSKLENINVSMWFYDSKYYHDNYNFYLKPALELMQKAQKICAHHNIPFVTYEDRLEYFKEKNLNYITRPQYKDNFQWQLNNNEAFSSKKFIYTCIDGHINEQINILFDVELESFDIIELFEDFFKNNKIISSNILDKRENYVNHSFYYNIIFNFEFGCIDFTYDDNYDKNGERNISYKIFEL